MIQGVIFAVGALIAWTFGDFSIQRAVRKIGGVQALLAIGLFGSIVLLPFVYGEFSSLFLAKEKLILLTVAGVVIFFAALFDFEALKQGKLAIIEPVYGIELPVTIALAIIFLKENPTVVQGILMVTCFIGIILTVTIHYSHLHIHKRILEKGVMLAGLGAIVMGLANFLVGTGSELVSPLMTIWFTNTVFSILCIVLLLAKGKFRTFSQKISEFPGETLQMVILDNAAWSFFALAIPLIPVSIATTISESYIAFAVLLGVYVNHEKIKLHQKIGICVAFISIFLLAMFTV